MSFHIDKQTLEELNLSGKFRQGSVYQLYNRTRTHGGHGLLDFMFNHPLDNAGLINGRTTLFRYFQAAAVTFPFDPLQVASMGEYIDGAAMSSALLNYPSVFIKKILSSVTRDERYRKIIQGLHATILTLRTCQSFLSTLTNIPASDDLRVAEVREIMQKKDLQRLMDIDIYQPIGAIDLSRYEHLLKKGLHDELQSILSFIYALDVFIAVAETARVKGFHYAVAMPAEANVFEAASIYHPGLSNPVGNPVSLKQTSNVLFLTGANMAGKSTLMKAIGIAMYTAHLGFPVPARDMRFSIRDGLYSSINVADNISRGYSHFYAEVMRVKQAAMSVAGGQRLLLMFDELFKGTNVKDAYDGTLEVTRGFAAYSHCLFVLSTHIIEVAHELKAQPNIQFVYLPTLMDGVKPKYTYTIQKGITEDRQGMLIIRNEGILELLQPGH